MRFATFVYAGAEHWGLVVQDPWSGADWVFDPIKIEELADTLVSLKGHGYRWYRPHFMDGKKWPHSLVQFLALGQQGIDAARRMFDFVSRYIEQGDIVLLRKAGYPMTSLTLRAPIPQPRLLLGVVGNNAGFVRMDTARARNIHLPACHLRPQTSILAAGQPIVIPEGNESWGGTTELGVVIGTGGRDIPREEAMDHVAGYTVVNDGSPSWYGQRWKRLDGLASTHHTAEFHFHAANTASWLGKSIDTMCAIGPFLVTKEVVGDPYDLMCYYREGGVLRNRTHSGALCCGIEELIHWVSQFITLEPGMLLHMGAMGRDGVRVDQSADFGTNYFVEAEIEQVGILRNPVVLLDKRDWRAVDDPGRSIHPVPLVRDLIAVGRDCLDEPENWSLAETRHFWTLTANCGKARELQGIAPKPYPMAYSAPVTALAISGSTVRLPHCARTIRVTCELGLVIKSLTLKVSPEQARQHILGYVVLAVLRDSSFEDSLIQPHFLDANMPELYNRWPDGFNIISSSPIPLADEAGRKMTFSVDGIGEVHGSTDAYVLDGPTVISELSARITMLPGDVVSLGRTAPLLTIPFDRRLPPGTHLQASIVGLGQVTAILDDQRVMASAER